MLDQRCKVRSTDNLFVTDASICAAGSGAQRDVGRLPNVEVSTFRVHYGTTPRTFRTMDANDLGPSSIPAK